MSDIEPTAAGFKIIETADAQLDASGERCFAVVDRDQRIVWVYKDTPDHLRQGIISEALQRAARVVYRPVLSL